MDLLGNMFKCLFLYLQPCLQEFAFIREFELLFFAEVPMMTTPVQKKKGNDKKAQQQ
jgi:hypothetical protein